MGTLPRLGRIVLAAGILLLMIAYMAIPATSAGKGDIVHRIEKDITAFQKEVTTALEKLAGFKPGLKPAKRASVRQPPKRVKPARIKPSASLPISTVTMKRLVASLSRTVAEAAKKCRGCKAVPPLKKRVEKLGRATEALRKAAKQGDKPAAIKILGKMSSALSAMNSQSKMFVSDVKKLGEIHVKPPQPYRFKIHGIKEVSRTDTKVKFQVQYYISPNFPEPCFIGANIPNCAHPSTKFGYGPAGRLPDGVPKGHKHFRDNITFEMVYRGSGAYTSKTIEVKIYTKKRRLGSTIINWGRTWGRAEEPKCCLRDGKCRGDLTASACRDRGGFMVNSCYNCPKPEL